MECCIVSKARTHSDRAIEAALAAMNCRHPTTAAITLFIAAARHLDASIEDKRRIAELAYAVADDIAVGLKP